MEWEGREESSNVEDRRGMGAPAMAIGGGSIILVLLGLFLGVDPSQLGNIFRGGGGGGQAPPKDSVRPGKEPVNQSPEEKRQASFAKVIFKDTEIVWDKLFNDMGKTYRRPILVLFKGAVNSACGTADSAVGPFYCGGDYRVYIDLSFFHELESKLGAPGEFARAYVLAHEVGHHVQGLLGYSEQVQAAARRKSKDYNRLSVRLELQADYLAGVWAHHAKRMFKKNYIDDADINSALKAAYQIGDDTLQRKGRGTVVPDSFTHGTSEQRQRWFREGFRTGDASKAALDRLFNLDYDEL